MQFIEYRHGLTGPELDAIKAEMRYPGWLRDFAALKLSDPAAAARRFGVTFAAPGAPLQPRTAPPPGSQASAAAPTRSAQEALEDLAGRAYKPGSSWGGSGRAATPPAPKPSVSQGVPGAADDPPQPLSAEAAAFEARLDPDRIYERWNAWMNPGPAKKRAQEDD